MLTVTITSFGEESKYSNIGDEILKVTVTDNASFPGLRIGLVVSMRSIWT